MVMRERVTLAVLAVLGTAAVFYGRLILEQGLGAETGRQMAVTAIAIIVGTIVLATWAAATGAKTNRVDERDNRVALKSQVFRGFLYLSLSFGMLGIAVGEGNYSLANALFLAILAIEIVSGVVMLALYRFSA